MIRLVTPEQMTEASTQAPPQQLFWLYYAAAAAVCDVVAIDCWQQTDSDQTVTAWLFRRDCTIFLCTTQTADHAELQEFLRILGGTLCCNLQTARALGLQETRSYEILCTQASGRREPQPAPRGETLYTLLSSCFSMPPFAQWYPDFYLALRRSVADVFCHEQDGVLCSCVSVLSLTSNTCLLSAVATAPEYRGRGYASSLLARAKHSLGERTAFLLAEAAMIPFYQKNGFSSCGRWSETEF